ncbi:hypothetical protein H6F96_25620 [Microcoleus sp. FACHB-53]|nr:hypothetical protein [Microcoleus sp. FACHB-53]
MLSPSRHSLSQVVPTSIIAVVCVLAVGMLQVPQLNALRSGTQDATPEALQREVNSENLRLNLLGQTPAFGFDNLLADWVFLNFLQYFGDDNARLQTGYALSPDYFKIIIARDPRFLGAYIPLSTSISLYAAKPDLSVALMEQGLKSMSPKSPPKSYYVWRLKGIDELLFLGNPQAARQSFEKAAEWATLYPAPESQKIAAFSLQTAQFLARNPLSKSAQVGAWAMIFSNVTDERTRQIVITRIEALGGQVIVTPQGEVKIRPPQSD